MNSHYVVGSVDEALSFIIALHDIYIDVEEKHEKKKNIRRHGKERIQLKETNSFFHLITHILLFSFLSFLSNHFRFSLGTSDDLGCYNRKKNERFLKILCVKKKWSERSNRIHNERKVELSVCRYSVLNAECFN